MEYYRDIKINERDNLNEVHRLQKEAEEAERLGDKKTAEFIRSKIGSYGQSYAQSSYDSKFISSKRTETDKKVDFARDAAVARYEKLSAFKKLVFILKGHRREQKRIDRKVEDYRLDHDLTFSDKVSVHSYEAFLDFRARQYDKLYGGAKKR